MFKLILLVGLAVAAVYADVSHVVAGYRRQPFGNRASFNAIAPAPAPVARQAYQSGPQIPILRQESNISPEGSYYFNYQTGNGISADERGDVRPLGPEQASKNVQGSYSFTSPEGIPISISYIADDNGFQAAGDSIPTPPPIPPEILKSLEYNAAHPEEEQAETFRQRQKYY